MMRQQDLNDIVKSIAERDKEITRLRAALAEAAKYGFVQGYNAGHADTVDGWYVDPTEKAENWYEDAEADGSLKEIIDAAMAQDEG